MFSSEMKETMKLAKKVEDSSRDPKIDGQIPASPPYPFPVFYIHSNLD